MIWYVIIYVICACSVDFLVKYQFEEFKVWQKCLMVILSPLVIVTLLIIMLCILPGHVKEHGFHDILPRKKDKAYPLDKDDFKYWPKDTILAGAEKMTISEFNKKNGKNLSLDDVYGSGYTDSLTPEEVFKCKTLIPNKYGLEPYMPDYFYKEVAIAFAKAFVNQDIRYIEQYLSPNTYLTLYKKKELSGGKAIADYFDDWLNRASEEKLEVGVTVKWQPNQCRPAVYIKPGDYREMVITLIEKNGKLTNVVFAPSHLQDYGCMFHDLDQPQYSLEYMSRFLEEDEETHENHLPCPICGFDSALIDWYKFHIPMGIHGYGGLVSICPDCKRVVELMPNIRIRYEEPQQVPFDRPLPENITEFTPKLLGLYTFETEDDNMDFYSDEELEVVCQRNLNAYRETGDLDKGNDAAVIFANGSHTEEAIALFTELAEKGCHDAMLNLFTIYWSNQGDYKKAVEWLQYISGIDNPSIKCLWNLAVLHYYGDNLPNNPLPKNHIKAKEIISRITVQAMDDKSDDVKRVIANAIKFYPLVDRLNDFSLSGIEIHDIILNSIVKTTGIKDKGELFNRAKALSLKPGYWLGLHLANDETQAIGDESYFFIFDGHGTEHKIFRSKLDSDNVDTSLISVMPTAMGAWQLYLLITSPTVMPVFWHGGYIVRKFIFSVEDLKLIEPIEHLDFSTLNHDGLLLPIVIMSVDGKEADVYCCYWNDWKGLVREHMRIRFNADGTASILSEDEFTFFKYDCGICY